MCKVCQRIRVKRRRDELSKDRAYRLWQWARDRAKATGVPFDITVDDVRAVFPERCPVTNQPWGKGRTASSLDRLRPARGYVKGNIAVISRRVNTIKSDADSKTILQLYRWLRRKGL